MSVILFIALFGGVLTNRFGTRSFAEIFGLPPYARWVGFILLVLNVPLIIYLLKDRYGGQSIEIKGNEMFLVESNKRQTIGSRGNSDLSFEKKWEAPINNLYKMTVKSGEFTYALDVIIEPEFKNQLLEFWNKS